MNGSEWHFLKLGQYRRENVSEGCLYADDGSVEVFTPTPSLGPCRTEPLFTFLTGPQIQNPEFPVLLIKEEFPEFCVSSCPPRLLESIRAVTLPDE